MRSRHLSPMQSLESRRLFAAVTLDVDQELSSITAAASLNSVPLTAQGENTVTATLDGTAELSSTSRGIKFLDGSQITATTEQGDAASFVFSTIASGPTVSLDDVAFGLTSTRINTDAGKFTATRLETDTAAGELNFSTGDTAVTVTGLESGLDYAVTRVQGNGEGALRLTIPMNFTVTASYTQGGVPQVLDMTFSGQMIARVAEGAVGQSLQAAATSPAQETDEDRVADSVLAG